MARSAELLRTIESVYAAGLDDTLWPQALAAITRMIGGVGTTLEVIDRRTFAHRQFGSFGIDPTRQTEYLDHFAALNPRFAPGLRLKPGEISVDYDFINERGMDQSSFYAEFLAAQHLRYVIAGTLETAKHEFGVVAVQRSPKQGHVGRVEIGLMQRLLPHLSKASDGALRLKGAGEARHSLERALDWLADGVALLRTDGAITYANASFQAIARGQDGIGTRKGAVEFLAADARDRFAAALRAIGRLRGGDICAAAVDFPVARPSGAPPYLVSVRPLFDKSRAGAMERVLAIIFVRDPLGRNIAAASLMRDVFGLTEAEAHLAQALQAGTPLDDYARIRALSFNTIYTHLRRIKEKTGCRRMPDLIRKLNDLQVPLRED